MKNFDSRTYNIEDFREWHERGQLVLNPKFQRRRVWTQNAKSFFIDTILRGKPIPKLFIRQNIDPKTQKSIREVVDGQQRLGTILDYLKDGFSVSRVHNKVCGGLVFSQLPLNMQTEILKYEISADLLINLPDSEVLEIFARLNTYTAVLRPQEKLNAKYFGNFKQLTYELGFKFVNFYTENQILTFAQVSRMEEAQLTSELLIAILEGIQSRKVIENYYKKYDNKVPNKDLIMSRFSQTVDLIGAIYKNSLANSNFARVQMYYSLFLALYDIFYKIPKSKYRKLKYEDSKLPKIKSVLDEIDALWGLEQIPPEANKFFEATRRGTTDIKARTIRHNYIMDKLVARV
ncbi:MAG: DUF262 domain-containing protein [Candidatus Omnitrophica bacterium]|nr:DUF262 domain-containing protein [Candidatus Omnitrophota bacterium]